MQNMTTQHCITLKRYVCMWIYVWLSRLKNIEVKLRSFTS